MHKVKGEDIKIRKKKKKKLIKKNKYPFPLLLLAVADFSQEGKGCFYLSHPLLLTLL
jgi:hypothetical protein